MKIAVGSDKETPLTEAVGEATEGDLLLALEVLRDVGDGDRLVVAMSTENLVSNENLLALTSVLENADLPLTRTTIDAIERSAA